MTNFYFEQSGNSIAVHAKTDVAVNAWAGTVEVPNTNSIASIRTNDSDGIFWKTIPTVETGRGILFAGGTPQGFTGDMVLFRFTLRAPVASLSFSNNSALYLGDGNGTEVLALNARFIPSTSVTYATTSAYQDTIPPTAFVPELYSDKNVFGNTPVVIFSAHDADSGIQKYEVRETTAGGFGDWRNAESPYAINADVTMLEIRAYDNAGNVRTESISTTPQASNVYAYLTLFGAVILLVFVYTIYKWRRNS